MSSADPANGCMLGVGVGELVVAASTGFMKRQESDSARVMDCMCATVAGDVERRRGRSLRIFRLVSTGSPWAAPCEELFFTFLGLFRCLPDFVWAGGNFTNW